MRNFQSTYIDNHFTENIFYFCKDCQKLVETMPIGRKFVYRCKVCGTKNVAFGSEKSLKSFYHIKEPNQELTKFTEEEKKAIDADKL